MPARTAAVERLSWSDFLADFRWEQGQHMTAIGPTGRGKTTLILELIRRAYPCPWRTVLASKARDPVLEELRDERPPYVVHKEWLAIDPDVYPRRILAPPLKRGAASKPEQARVFREALTSIFRQGGWMVYADELRYLTEFLGLREELELLWQQGRSLGVSVVGGVQRPRHVPLMAYDQATHLFFFHNPDVQTIKRMEEMTGGLDTSLVRDSVISLSSEGHEVLYANTVTGQLVITRAEI
jgi:hypothetical protein